MAENIGKLNYQITADQSAFTVGMAKASSDVEKFSQTCRNQSNASAATFDGLAKAAGSSFSGLQTGGLAGGFGALKASVAELSGTLLSMGGIATGVFVGLAAGLAAIASEANNVTKAVDGIRKMSQVIGDTTFNTLVGQGVLERAGFDQKGAQDFLLKLSDKIGDMKVNNFTGPVADALRRINLSPQAIGNASPVKAFEEIINALHGVGDASLRAASAQAIFSKQFTEVADLVRGGRGGFDRARSIVRATGADSGTFAASAQAQQFSRMNAAEGAEIDGFWSQRWNAMMAGISLAYQREKHTFNTVGYDIGNAINFAAGRPQYRRPSGGAGPDIPDNFRSLGMAGELRQIAMEKANAAATKLAANWDAIAAAGGRSGRALEIYQAQLDGASASHLEILRLRDRELAIIERRNEAERSMKGLIDSNRSGLEKFYDVLRQVNIAGLDRFGQTRALGAAFRDLERSLGSSGGDQHLTGTDVGSMEAFRMLANRDNGGQNMQGRILDVLQTAREIQERQLLEAEEVTRLLRNMPGLGVAPMTLPAW